MFYGFFIVLFYCFVFMLFLCFYGFLCFVFMYFLDVYVVLCLMAFYVLCIVLLMRVNKKYLWMQTTEPMVQNNKNRRQGEEKEKKGCAILRTLARRGWLSVIQSIKYKSTHEEANIIFEICIY